MSAGIKVGEQYQMEVILPDGHTSLLGTQNLYKAPNKAKKLNARVETLDFLTLLSDIAKSSKDILILKELIAETNVANDILIPSLTKFATNVGTSPESLKKLLKRADDNGLFHKIGTGHYMLNPFVLLSKGLTYAGGDKQCDAQIRWRAYTVIMTESDKQALVKLSEFLNREVCLPTNNFTIDVANKYVAKGNLTDLQMEAIRKYYS